MAQSLSVEQGQPCGAGDTAHGLGVGVGVGVAAAAGAVIDKITSNARAASAYFRTRFRRDTFAPARQLNGQPANGALPVVPGPTKLRTHRRLFALGGHQPGDSGHPSAAVAMLPHKTSRSIQAVGFVALQLINQNLFL